MAMRFILGKFRLVYFDNKSRHLPVDPRYAG